jgi:toxin ParE1/3/4
MLSVHLSANSLTQLASIHRYISEASSAQIATRYVDAILDECESLQTFPNRGTLLRKNDPSLRRIGFRRRVVIFYRIKKKSVEIAAIYYGGQDFKKDFQ